MFDGTYLKFGNAPFPTELLITESYKCKPNQRIIIDSFQDNNRTEHRDVSKNKRSSVTVKTKDYLTTDEKNKVVNSLNQGLLNEIEGKYQVTFFNPLTDGYEDMEAFLTDIEFVVAMQLDSGPVYAGVEIILEQNRS